MMSNYTDDDGDTIIDDGLSTFGDDEERQQQTLTSSQAAARRKQARQYRIFTLFLLSITFIASVIITTLRYYGYPRSMVQENGGGGSGSDIGNLWDVIFGNGHSKKENERRLQQTLDYLITFDVSDPKTLDPRLTLVYGGGSFSPQYEAARWIATFDKYRINIPTEEYEYIFIQRYALAVLFFSTGGDTHWTWKLNFLTGWHECAWYDKFQIQNLQQEFVFGVLCDGKPDFTDEDSDIQEKDVWNGQRFVTGISLPPLNNMVGKLPAEVHHLRYLKVLHIQDNTGLSGEIPFQYGWLKHMTAIALMSNDLNGKIPRSFAQLTKLDVLWLERNQLNGDSTQGDLDFLIKMTNLTQLVLDYNSEIVGTLPDLSKLTKLKQLSLSNTGLGGSLPQSLSSLTELRRIYLDDCSFEGSVEVLQSMNLTHVYLEDNMFTGNIDDNFFAQASSLVHLDASNCSFSGTVPGHLFNLPDLTVLDLSMNSLEGQLPDEQLSSVQESKLEFLSLHTNNITGSIPPSIGKLKSLTTLDLSINQFMNIIPSSISDLTNLDILFLGRNNFDTGLVPEWIRSMTGLTELSLKNASLTGNIPEWLGDLTNLTFLDLGENELMDTIPQSLGSLSELMVLILNRNQLTGELGLGGLSKLETLLIDDNALTGNTDAMCTHTITHFVSDCTSSSASDAEIECSCCTLCCSDENTTCNDAEWFGNHGGIWETGYIRVKYDFDEGMVSPLVDYDALP